MAYDAPFCIQSSTSLWERASADVMNASLELHHTTIRRVLLRHNGYESATEVKRWGEKREKGDEMQVSRPRFVGNPLHCKPTTSRQGVDGVKVGWNGSND